MSSSTHPAATSCSTLQVRFVQPRPSDPTAGLASLKLATMRLRARNERMARGLALGFRRVENAVTQADMLTHEDDDQ